MLSGYSEPKNWNRLVLAPLWLRDTFMRLIRRETVLYDARLKRIVVTEKGLQYQGMIRESLEETERRLTAGITEDDLATFFRVISRMIRNMS